jgi:hypothetical protein
MKCKAIRTCLLGLEQPDQPLSELTAHLAECLPCRDWLQQLLVIERGAAHLPVPPAEGKTRLLARILAEPTVRVPAPKPAPPPAAPLPAPRSPLLHPEPVWLRHERRVKRLALVSALAAALVLVAVGLWAWRHTPNTPKGPPQPVAEDPLLKQLMKRNVRLASAATPRQRVEALAEIANDLQGETQSLSQVASDRDLAALAQLYGKVVREGIVPRAQTLPAAERAAVLGPIVDQLERAWKDADALADQAPASAVRPLREIAAAARHGDVQLRGLLRGEKS